MSKHIEEFQLQVYEETKKLFPEGAVDVLVAPEPEPGSPQRASAAVRVIHKATGRVINCSHYDSRIQNRIIATLQLRVACDRGTA